MIRELFAFNAKLSSGFEKLSRGQLEFEYFSIILLKHQFQSQIGFSGEAYVYDGGLWLSYTYKLYKSISIDFDTLEESLNESTTTMCVCLCKYNHC